MVRVVMRGQSLAIMGSYSRLHGVVVALLVFTAGAYGERDYGFDGDISRGVLENYLSRAVTFIDLLSGVGDVDGHIGFLTHTGAKFAGRTIYRWGGEDRLDALLAVAKPIAEKVHAADREIILQGAIFEIVTARVAEITVPAWLFEEFGLPVEQRNFRYEAMCYPDGHRVDHWSKDASVPDMSRLETRMWFVYAAARYIDVGVEAIHFGQVEIMDDRDPEHVHWRDMLARCRGYAQRHARRHLLLCDAHVPGGGIVHEGNLMFDFHSFPLRIEEVADKPHEGVLQAGYLDSLFGRSAGGVSPSGWRCEHLPYLVELDNFEGTPHPGENIGGHWCWGWDEISWFANQPGEYRNQWLRYAWSWIRKTDPNGFLQMPASRCLVNGPEGKGWYWGHMPSATAPDGFGQEDTIQGIWAEDRRLP